MTSSVFDIPLTRIDGRAASLADYGGKVLLIVNVASKCGLTPQYEGLERLYEAKRGEGLEVLGFPANNFAGQEPGSDAEIAEFCSLTYDVNFPLFSKISVKGADQHPLYQALTSARRERTGEGAMVERLKAHGIDAGAPGEVLWNFEKFLIGRDGAVVERFAPDIPADDERLVAAVERELAKAV